MNAKNNVRTDANAEEAARPTPHIFGQSTPMRTVLQVTLKIEFFYEMKTSVHIQKVSSTLIVEIKIILALGNILLPNNMLKRSRNLPSFLLVDLYAGPKFGKFGF